MFLIIYVNVDGGWCFVANRENPVESWYWTLDIDVALCFDDEDAAEAMKSECGIPLGSITSYELALACVTLEA